MGFVGGTVLNAPILTECNLICGTDGFRPVPFPKNQAIRKNRSPRGITSRKTATLYPFFSCRSSVNTSFSSIFFNFGLGLRIVSRYWIDKKIKASDFFERKVKADTF